MLSDKHCRQKGNFLSAINTYEHKYLVIKDCLDIFLKNSDYLFKIENWYSNQLYF